MCSSRKSLSCKGKVHNETSSRGGAGNCVTLCDRRRARIGMRIRRQAPATPYAAATCFTTAVVIAPRLIGRTGGSDVPHRGRSYSVTLPSRCRWTGGCALLFCPVRLDFGRAGGARTRPGSRVRPGLLGRSPGITALSTPRAIQPHHARRPGVAAYLISAARTLPERGRPTARDRRRGAARGAGRRQRGVGNGRPVICAGHVRNSQNS